MRKCIAILLIILIISVSCICVYAENITELQEKSDEVTQNLNEANNRLQAVQDEVSDNMKNLQELDTQVAQSQEEINKIKIDLETLQTQIQENEQKLAKVQAEFDNLQDLVDSRIVELYKQPKLQIWDTIFTATSVTDFLNTYYSIIELNRYDTELLETVRTQKNEIETTKKILEEKKKQAILGKQEEQKKTQVLQNKKTKREYFLNLLTAEEKELQAEIDEYNKQVNEIEAEIRLLALNNLSEDYIGGAFVWPIPGHTSLTSLYGMRVHPITKAYKLHTGIDVSAGIGTSFVAAANGVVSKATFNTAYGNMVIIDHGGGVQTLYAHGSEIMVQVGDEVKAGDEVLKVGSTGYSTGPHAHFEIRINGQTVNPLDYLLDTNKILSNKQNTEATQNLQKTESTQNTENT